MTGKQNDFFCFFICLTWSLLHLVKKQGFPNFSVVLTVARLCCHVLCVQALQFILIFVYFFLYTRVFIFCISFCFEYYTLKSVLLNLAKKKKSVIAVPLSSQLNECMNLYYEKYCPLSNFNC